MQTTKPHHTFLRGNLECVTCFLLLTLLLLLLVHSLSNTAFLLFHFAVIWKKIAMWCVEYICYYMILAMQYIHYHNLFQIIKQFTTGYHNHFIRTPFEICLVSITPSRSAVFRAFVFDLIYRAGSMYDPSMCIIYCISELQKYEVECVSVKLGL